MSDRRLLLAVFAALAGSASAEPELAEVLARQGAGPTLQFAREGGERYVRIDGTGRDAAGAKCSASAPSSGWARLTPNDTPDAHRYSMESFFADLGANCTAQVHRLGERYAVVETSAGCAAVLPGTCAKLRFDGVYGPGDETFDGANASPQTALEDAFRRANATLNERWQQLRPRLGDDDNLLRGEQRAWVANKEKGCKTFEFAPNRLACATAMTIARTAVLDDALPSRADREHLAGLATRRIEPANPLYGGVTGAVVSALRPRLHADVELVDAEVRASGDWFAVSGKPRTANGTKPDFRGTEWAEAAQAGALEDSVHALLKRTAGKPGIEVAELAVGPTDVYWSEWVSRHGAPQALFFAD